MNSILIQPLITEKSTRLNSHGWYTFRVDKKSAKQTIAKAIGEQFKVHVVAIKTLTMRGKQKRAGKKRLLTRSSDFKKALVRLKDNEKIALFGFENQK